MKRFVGARALVAASLLAFVCFAISASGAGAAAPTGARVLAPKPLIPHGAKALGAVSPTATVSGAVVLQPGDPDALTRFIAQMTDKHSPLFHHYLTPSTFAERFGPTPSTIEAVKSQLQASGLSVTSVARDGLIVHFQAPASHVETRFPHRPGALPPRQRLDRPGADCSGPGAGDDREGRCRSRRPRHHRAASALQRPPRAQVGPRHLPGCEDGREVHPPGGLAHALRRRDGRGRGVRRPDRRPDRERVRRVRPLRRRRYRLGPAHRRLRVGAVRDERPPDLRHLLLRRDAGRRDARPRAHRQRGRRPARRAGLGRGDSRHPGRVRVRAGREHRRVRGAEHHVRRARRVREDRQRQRRQDRDEQLGPLRAGGAAGLAGHSAGREHHLPAGGRPGADRLLGCGRRGQQRLQRFPDDLAGQPGAVRRRPIEPALRRGRQAGPRSTTPPSPRPSTSGTMALRGARPAAASPRPGRCRPGSSIPRCRA